MKVYLPIISSLGLLLGAGCATSQPLYAEPPVTVATVVPATVTPMDQLLAPIALYPDALVAIILPAATASSDVVLAARFLSTDNRPEAIEDQPWDDSVKALAHYPEVVRWMDENLAWTQQLGVAYLDQPQEVMAAIQRNRLRARASGILVDTPQQQVIIEDGYVRIIPAQPDVIYVPRYDPQIVYIEQPVYYTDPWLSFGIGFGVGSWLSYDCDWRSRSIWVNHNRDRWRDNRDWRYFSHPRPGYTARPPGWNVWRPTPGRPRPYPGRFDGNNWRHHPQPRPIVGAPNFDERRSREHFADRQPKVGAGRPDGDRTRVRRDAVPGVNPVAAPGGNTPRPPQNVVTNPADERRDARPDQRRREGNNPNGGQWPRNHSSDQARGDRRPGNPVTRTEAQAPAASVPNPVPADNQIVNSPVAPIAAPTPRTVSNPPSMRSRPGVVNAPQRHGQPGNGNERSAEVRASGPRTPSANNNLNPRRDRPVPSVSNPVVQQVAPAPVVRSAPMPSRQNEVRSPAPSLPRVERSVAPPPQVSQQSAPRVPPPQASARQDNGNSSGRGQRGADRTDRDQN